MSTMNLLHQLCCVFKCRPLSVAAALAFNPPAKSFYQLYRHDEKEYEEDEHDFHIHKDFYLEYFHKVSWFTR